MKVIYNDYIPLGKFVAMNLFGILFVRRHARHLLTPKLINHELIHSRQQRELLYIFFFILYFAEYIVRLVQTGFHPQRAYLSISFEREAYRYESELRYLNHRRSFAFLRFYKLSPKGKTNRSPK